MATLIVVLPRGYVGKRQPETWDLARLVTNMQSSLEITNTYDLSSGVLERRRGPRHVYTMSCEYLTGNIVVKLFYDWDFPCPHLDALTPNMTQPALDHIQFELDQTQLEQLNLFLAAMQKAHPDVQIPDLALAARSGWKVKRKSSGWFVSLRCFVQGKCMYIEDIRRHIDNVFGENECSQLDRSVYKKTEQCLALVGGHKEAGDKRILVPLTHTDRLEAFVVQDISGCELISPAPPATPAAVITVPQKRKATIRDEENRPSPSASGSAQTASPTHLLNWIHGTFDVEPSLVQLDKIKPLGNSNYSIPTSSRQCPFAKREHNSNHIYFTVCYNFERGTVTVQLKCHDSDCSQRSNMVTVNSSSPVMQDALTRLGAVQSTNDTTAEPEQQVAVTTDMKHQAVRQSLAGIQKQHPKMDCSVVDDSDLLQPTTLANGGFVTLLRNNLYCPLHKTMHDNWMNCVFFTEATQQLMCRQDVTQTLSLPVEKSQINVIFNINVTQTDTANETRDFGAFDIFPQLFENRDIDYLCYKSLNGTTITFAKVAAEMIKGKYIFQDKIWYHFKGRVWAKDPGPDDLIGTEMVEIYSKLQNVYSTPQQVKWLNLLIHDLSNLNKRKPYTEELERHVTRQAEDIPFDDNVHLLGFQNGVYDSNLRVFREHRAEDYLTTLQPYALPSVPDSDVCRQIEHFFADILPCARVREYVMLLLALHLEGSNKHAVGMIWTGSGGNGKGVLKELMKYTFGPLHSEPPATFLTSERPSPEKPAPHLVDLRLKRSVITSEPEAGKKANSAFLKFITGNDTVTCRALHSNDMISFVPRFIVTLLCNVVPLFQGGQDEIRGLWRRLKIIHFPTEFVDEIDTSKPHQKVKDPELLGRLGTWAPHFMAMLIETFDKYVQQGKRLPKAPPEVEKNLEEQKSENNPLEAFMRDCMVSAPNSQIHIHKVLVDFKEYLRCESITSTGNVSTTGFTRRLENMGYEVTEDKKKIRACCDKSLRALLHWHN